MIKHYQITYACNLFYSHLDSNKYIYRQLSISIYFMSVLKYLSIKVIWEHAPPSKRVIFTFFPASSFLSTSLFWSLSSYIVAVASSGLSTVSFRILVIIHCAFCFQTCVVKFNISFTVTTFCTFRKCVFLKLFFLR